MNAIIALLIQYGPSLIQSGIEGAKFVEEMIATIKKSDITPEELAAFEEWENSLADKPWQQPDKPTR